MDTPACRIGGPSSTILSDGNVPLDLADVFVFPMSILHDICTHVLVKIILDFSRNHPTFHVKAILEL